MSPARIGGIAAAAIVLGGSLFAKAPPPITPAMTKSAARQHIDVAALNAGRATFAGRCARCHSLPDVNRYRADAWPSLVMKMSKRSGLSPAQRDAVVAYILAARQP